VRGEVRERPTDGCQVVTNFVQLVLCLRNRNGSPQPLSTCSRLSSRAARTPRSLLEGGTTNTEPGNHMDLRGAGGRCRMTGARSATPSRVARATVNTATKLILRSTTVLSASARPASPTTAPTMCSPRFNAESFAKWCVSLTLCPLCVCPFPSRCQALSLPVSLAISPFLCVCLSRYLSHTLIISFRSHSTGHIRLTYLLTLLTLSLLYSMAAKDIDSLIYPFS
jgi:hypothetical protein